MTDNPFTESTTKKQRGLVPVSKLLSQPRLAYFYTVLLKMDGWTTTQEIVETVEFSQSTVYKDMKKLRTTSLVTVRKEGKERYYRAEPFKVGVIAEDGLTIITPSITAVIGQQVVDEDVEQFVDNYGVEKLVEIVEYIKPYIDGRMTERLATRELDLPTIVGMTILIALEDRIREMRDIDPYFDDVQDATEDGGQRSSAEIQFNDRTWAIEKRESRVVPDSQIQNLGSEEVEAL